MFKTYFQISYQEFKIISDELEERLRIIREEEFQERLKEIDLEQRLKRIMVDNYQKKKYLISSFFKYFFK